MSHFSIFLPFLVSFIWVFPLSLSAQSQAEQNWHHMATIGYPFGVFDSPNAGIHLGYNPTYRLWSQLSLEGQASVTYGRFKRDSGTFAQDGGNLLHLNFLTGLRLYVLKPDKRVRPYLNYLGGYALISNQAVSYTHLTLPTTPYV